MVTAFCKGEQDSTFPVWNRVCRNGLVADGARISVPLRPKQQFLFYEGGRE